MSQMDEIVIEIDEIIDNNNDTNNDKIDNHYNDNPHNGEPIEMIKISPNGNYLVTYSKVDHSIVGWNVDVDKGELKLEFTINNVFTYEQIYVSDDKKIAYIDNVNGLKTYDMMNNPQKVKLGINDGSLELIDYCTFNLKREFIVYQRGIVFIYSTQTKNNIWNCKRLYKLFEVHFISITEYDKVYLFLNNIIYEFDLVTEKSTKILVIDKEIKHEGVELVKYINNNIKIFSNEKFVCTRINDKISIYSVELGILIDSLELNNAYQLRKLMKLPDLFSLLFPLFIYTPSSEFWDSITKNYWKKWLCYTRITELENNTNVNTLTTNKYAFRFLDGDVWMTDFEEMISNVNSLVDDEIAKENQYFDDDNVKIDEDMNKTYDHSHILLNSYIGIIHGLFKEAISNSEPEYNILKPNSEQKQQFIQNSIKWEIITYSYQKTLKLLVSKKKDVKNEWVLIRERYEKLNDNLIKPVIKLLNENDIIILTNVGLLIYHFNENDRSISLNYFYYFYVSLYNKEKLTYFYNEVFSKADLPSPNYESFECNDEWVSGVKNNKEILLKYGVDLCKFAVKNHKLELLDEIYKKCISHFKEDLGNNRMFLSIITSTMPLVNEFYPEYIERYSLETTMVIDSLTYSMEYRNNNLHLFSFQYPHMVIFVQSILWFKHNELMSSLYESHSSFIQYLITHLILPIYFATIYILSKCNLIYFKVAKKFSKHKKIPTLIFMNPYIKFVNYPKDYDWFKELIQPQPSPFVKIINRDIYKTWNGESLINFKWNNYGRYYYVIIWIVFMAFLGCFTAAATITNIDDDVRNKLLIASIILGFIHLSFEVRQIIYDIEKWIQDFWNMFDVIAYVLPIFTSILWLQTSEIDIIPLLSFSCLFLDIKFLLFFRAFERFGVYFAIIISVAKQIISFLVVLFIIIISFAHAFYILLVPRSQFSFETRTKNNDPNNPWNMVSSYNQVFENGTIDPNAYIIQPPDEKTNMFIDFRTAIFAVYLFLTGDSSAFSNWSYTNNSSLVILIVLFTLLIFVYLMNLFIGLLNNAIEKDNDRVSYLVQKAEILAEIELFYLLPHQRRWNAWFPEVIYYHANVDNTRKKIKEMINKGEWNTDEFPEMKKMLLKELNIEDITNKPIDETTLRQILIEMKDKEMNDL